LLVHGQLQGLDLKPELLRRDGAFPGAVDEWVGGGFAFCIDEEFFAELFAGSQASAHDLDIALGMLGIAATVFLLSTAVARQLWGGLKKVSIRRFVGKR
jgi:hypothetical protein